MERVDLRESFHREIEVLELNDDFMIYALDQKNEIRDLCSIERMELSSREVQRLVSLDYTRLWESFRTYAQMPGFFYAVNVLADYRLRLRKIDKTTWEISSDILINPEGEIINIYSLNEDYLIVTDEVKATPEILEKYGLKDEGHRYVNVRYLYEFKTAKKYPIVDGHFDSKTEEIPVCLMAGEPTVVYEAFYREEARENAEGMSEIAVAAVDSLIAHIKADGLAGFRTVARAGEDGFDYVRRLAVAPDRILYRRRQAATGREQLVEKTVGANGGYDTKVLADYVVPAKGEVFYDISARKVYWCPDGEDAPVKNIRCLSEEGPDISYDGKYGTFLGLFDDELLATAYYEEVFVKEYEYHEYVALHDLKSGQVDTAAGRMEHTGRKVVLLRSFLAL